MSDALELEFQGAVSEDPNSGRAASALFAEPSHQPQEPHLISVSRVSYLVRNKVL